MVRCSRPLSLPALVAAGLALLAGCGGGDASRLLIVTTSDVLGKTSPCGCYSPRGGLARRATFLDSVRAARPSVLALDAGGFFPVTDEEREAGPFLLQAMAKLRTDAAGVGSPELRFGYEFVREQARAAGVPLVCANLSRLPGGGPAFERWRMLTAGRTKVGVFGLLPDTADLGPGRDSLRADPPEAAARRAIAALRAQGATVIVLLSQLGKAAGESLATRVPGVDLLVGGGGAPIMPGGVGAGRGIAVYGGNQGWELGVAEVRLDGERRVSRIDAHTLALGPAVRTQPAMAASVQAFEDSLNAHLRARDLAFGVMPSGSVTDFVGVSGCMHCHAREYVQWRTTAHARAWKTLVEQKKESTPACLPCHVTGFARPGGYQGAGDASRLAGVQCEACHGRGTLHREWTRNGNYVPESACRTCHTPDTSPEFQLAVYRPHVLHSPPPGLRPMPETPTQRLMREGKPPHAR